MSPAGLRERPMDTNPSALSTRSRWEPLMKVAALVPYQAGFCSVQRFRIERWYEWHQDNSRPVRWTICGDSHSSLRPCFTLGYSPSLDPTLGLLARPPQQRVRRRASLHGSWLTAVRAFPHPLLADPRAQVRQVRFVPCRVVPVDFLTRADGVQ